MLHILSGAVFILVLAVSLAVIIATVRAEMASIRRVLGRVQYPPVTPPAFQARVRVVRRAEFRQTQSLQARAA